MMNRPVFCWFAAGLAALLLFACSPMVKPPDLFPLENDDFVLRMRWLDFQAAAQHIAEADRPAFLERFADNDDLRVVDFEVDRIDFRDDGHQVEVGYVLEYYRLPSATVKKERFHLKWEFREEEKLSAGTWLITTEFPQLP